MAGTSRRAALAAVFVLMSAVMLAALPGIHSVLAYWAVSAVAIAGAVVLIVAGESAWDRMLVNARAAGVVAPY